MKAINERVYNNTLNIDLGYDELTEILIETSSRHHLNQPESYGFLTSANKISCCK